MVVTKETRIAIEEAVANTLRKKEIINQLSANISEDIIQIIEGKFAVYDEKIEGVQAVAEKLHSDNKKLRLDYEQKIDVLEQQLKNNKLRFYGIPEVRSENLVEIIVEFCKHTLHLKIDPNDISRCQRVGKFKTTEKNKNRAILVTFSTYLKRMEVFKSKRSLKNTNYFIGEDLTRIRLNKYKEAVISYGRENVWTSNGIIYVKSEGDVKKIKPYEMDDTQNREEN